MRKNNNINLNKRHDLSYNKRNAVENFSSKNMINEKRLASHIVDLAGIDSHELVMDIGAGEGALTYPLIKKAGKVLCVESDHGFAEKLRNRFAIYDNIRIIEKDILKVRPPHEPFSVVSNIPFSITTRLMDYLMGKPNTYFTHGVLMVEKGAALRFTAVPITNPLILSLRIRYDFEILEILSRNHFNPKPKVDVAVLSLKKRPDCHIKPNMYLHFVDFAMFCLKSPYLSVGFALKDIFTYAQIKRVCKEMHIDRNMPVCDLNIGQWSSVFEVMCQYVDSNRWPKNIMR